jgi:hypothetical protein
VRVGCPRDAATCCPFRFGLSRVGAYALQKAEGEEDASVVLMFGIMAVAGILARTINLALPTKSNREKNSPRHDGGDIVMAQNPGQHPPQETLLRVDYVDAQGQAGLGLAKNLAYRGAHLTIWVSTCTS